MLGAQNPSRQACLIVTGTGWHNRLGDDRSSVDLRANEVHGATGEAHTRRQRLTLRVEAGESRQQRRVDIDHSVAPRVHERSVQDAHEPRQTDQLDVLAAEQGFGSRCKCLPSVVRNNGAAYAG